MYLKEISQNQGKLHGYLNAIHPYQDEVNDILQDTNVTLINKQKDFDSSKKFLPWAFSIAKFTWLAHKKKRAREGVKLKCDSDLMDVVLDLESTSLRDDLMYEMELERLNLLDLIRKRLTWRQNALLDALLEGKSLHEICDEWNANYSAVSTLKTRMVKKMKSILLEIKLSRRYDYSD